MKLRFGVDAAARDQIRERLDARSEAAPVARRLAYVYLDTPDGALARHGAALRFRRRTALDAPAGGRWKRQEMIRRKDRDARAPSLGKLGIPRLKQRLDATFTVRIERWTWRPREDWAIVSLDSGEVSTGTAHEAFDELRIVCKRKRADDAMHLAVELGAVHQSSTPRERGLALLAREETRACSTRRAWPRRDADARPPA